MARPHTKIDQQSFNQIPTVDDVKQNRSKVVYGAKWYSITASFNFPLRRVLGLKIGAAPGVAADYIKIP